MDIKTVTAVVAAIVSVASAGASIYSSQRASMLAEQKFDTETTLKILQTAYLELKTEGFTDQAVNTRLASCLFLAALSEAEIEAKKNLIDPVHFVDNFVQRAAAEGVISSICQAAMARQPKEETLASDSVDVSELSTWQVQIASYRNSSSGCRHAKADIDEFNRLLEAKDSQLFNLNIVQTTQTDFIAVSADIQADRAYADELVKKIRALSPETVNGRTGQDAIVRSSEGWALVKDCE